MPMIMDDEPFIDRYDDEDMADLFNDPQMMSTEHMKRLGELATTGVCRKLTWSKNGAIARLANGSITLQNLIQQHDRHEFVLSEPKPLQFPIEHPNFSSGFHPVHIQWSETGNDLSVLDAAGRILIYQMIPGLSDKAVCVGVSSPEQTDDVSGSIKGMIWLNTSHSISRHAIYAGKSLDQWTFPTSVHAPIGPCHPTPGKSALFLVNQSNTLRLVFFNLRAPPHSYEEVSIALESPESSPAGIKHASLIAEQGDTILLATVDDNHILKLYRVSIAWNYPFRDKEIPPSTFRLQPTINVTRLAVSEALVSESLQSRLYDLRVLPAVTDEATAETATGRVLAIFLGTDQSLQHYTRIVPVVLMQELEQLHESFSQLATKKNNSPAGAMRSTHELQLLPSSDVPGVVMDISTLRNHTVLAFANTDGSVIFFDRITSQPVSRNFEQPTMIRNMIEAGFGFPIGQLYSNIAFSPSGYALATCGEGDDELTIRYIDAPLEQEASLAGPENQELTLVALCLALAAIPISQGQTFEDVLDVIQRHAGRIHVPTFLSRALTALNIALTSTPHDAFQASQQRLLNSPGLVRYLILQKMLGSTPGMPEHMSQIAWAMMNLRHCAWVIHIGAASLQGGEQSADVPGSLLGIITWFLELSNDVVRHLYWLSRFLKNHEQNPGILDDMISTPLPPTLTLLFLTPSRLLSRSNTRFLRSLATTAATRLSSAKSSPSPSSTTPHYQSWLTLVSLLAKAHISPMRFEALLAETEHYVDKAYTDAGMDEAARVECEKGLMVQGVCPVVLRGVVLRLASSALEKVLEGTKDRGALMKLLSTQQRWIGQLWAASPWTGTGATATSPVIDVVRKVPLFGLKEYKHCMLCGSVMENIVPRAGRVVSWVATLQKLCVCGGGWVVKAPSDAHKIV